MVSNRNIHTTNVFFDVEMDQKWIIAAFDCDKLICMTINLVVVESTVTVTGLLPGKAKLVGTLVRYGNRSFS